MREMLRGNHEFHRSCCNKTKLHVRILPEKKQTEHSHLFQINHILSTNLAKETTYPAKTNYKII